MVQPRQHKHGASASSCAQAAAPPPLRRAAGNEGALPGRINTTGAPWELAHELGGLLVWAEVRWQRPRSAARCCGHALHMLRCAPIAAQPLRAPSPTPAPTPQHRHYGSSIPVPGAPTNATAHRYLTIEQALTDYIRLIRHVKDAFGIPDAPVVAIGGRCGCRGGTAWHRCACRPARTRAHTN